jgi:hypothetical protein
MSVLPHDLRLASITQGCQFFDHRDRAAHDNELHEGAAFILFQKLALAMSLSPNYQLEQDALMSSHRFRTVMTNNHADHEIALLCNCIEMVHRASPEAIAATWYEIGHEVLPLIVKVLERPWIRFFQQLRKRQRALHNTRTHPTTTVVSRDLKLAVQKLTKILALYSLVPEAKHPMAHCPGMLTTLVKIIDTRHFNHLRAHQVNWRNEEGGPTLVLTEAARFHTIATLTNLAAMEDNRLTMLREPRLVENIALLVQNERADVAKQCSALALMNLSNGDRHHVPEMSSDLLLETLTSLIQDENLPGDTRRNAAVTLFNVACVDENSLRVARFQDGVLLTALTEIIVNGAGQHDLLDESRANAAETLFNMSCSETEETLERLASHPGLVDGLATVLSSASVSIDVKMYCAATLRRLAEMIRAPMIAQRLLLNALVRASSWVRTSDIAEALEAHADVDENRAIMAEHPGVLDALSEFATTPGNSEDADKVRKAAVGAIERLARDDYARPFLAHHKGIMVALTMVTSNSLHHRLTIDQAVAEEEEYERQEYERQEYERQEYEQQDYEGQEYEGQEYDQQRYEGQEYEGQEYEGQQYEGQQYEEQEYEQEERSVRFQNSDHHDHHQSHQSSHQSLDDVASFASQSQASEVQTALKNLVAAM